MKLHEINSQFFLCERSTLQRVSPGAVTCCRGFDHGPAGLQRGTEK